MDEIAEIVDNFDDLDNELLGFDGGLKRKNPLESKNYRGKENQKKVVFQDFDDDTSLDDLLSDANDSTTNFKSHLTEASASKAADLFRIESTESRGISAANFVDSSAIKTSKVDYKPEKRVPIDRRTSPEPPRTLERLENIGSDISLLKAPDKVKKSALINDLYPSRPRASSLKDITKHPAKKNDEELVSESMPNLLGKDQSNKSGSSGFTLTSSNFREPRRGRARSAAIDDPLGFLASSHGHQEAQVTEKMTEKIEKKDPSTGAAEDLPEWLGGTKKSEKSGESKCQMPKEPDTTKSSVSKSEEKIIINSEVSQLTEAEFDQQAALLSLQQQEHELRTAALLSNQTDQFNSIIERQRNQLNEQEKIFNLLVKRQIERQSALDMEIKMQQVKIDHYMQILARQPTRSSALHKENEEINAYEGDRLREDCRIGSDNLINKLEIDKQNLERIVGILKDKHEKEIKILEDSHETQMHFMHVSLERLETKLREDTETLEKDYEKKIDKLVNEKNQLEEFFKEKLNNLKKEHNEEIKQIHDRHTEKLAHLQREYSETIENILRAKELEKKTMNFIELNKNNLDEILDKSRIIFDNYQTINEQLRVKENYVNDEKENWLKKQEEQLQAMREQLNSQQELLNNERKQLMIAADNLKAETSQLSQQFSKNNELLNETESRLLIREKAIIKDRELFQEQSQWERDHLQYLKESWKTEKKRQMQQLAAESEAIANEKAKLEVYNHLKINSDDFTKAELEAAIKAAQEARQSANLERKKWQERISSQEADEEKIREKEKNLMERAKELENLTQSAILKREEGLRALKEAHRIEKQYKERTSQLEMQLELLTKRENKVASEQFSLARERLAIKIHDKPEKDVSNNSFHSQMHQPYSLPQVQTYFKDVVDPQLLLLKLNLDNKLDTSNQLISDMQIID